MTTKMNRNLHKQRTGFTLIELLIVIAVIAILAAIAIPNLLSSRKSANETSAIGSMRTIISAEATYRSRNSAYTSLASLGTSSLIDPALAASATTPKSGYTIAVSIPTGSTNQFYAVASPADTSSGDRIFYTDEAGVIFAAPAVGTTAPTADSSGVAPTGFTQIGN